MSTRLSSWRTFELTSDKVVVCGTVRFPLLWNPVDPRKYLRVCPFSVDYFTIVRLFKTLNICSITIDTTLAHQIPPILQYLRDDANLLFKQIIDISGVDYPQRENRFDVVYHMLSVHNTQRYVEHLSTLFCSSSPLPPFSSLLHSCCRLFTGSSAAITCYS